MKRILSMLLGLLGLTGCAAEERTDSVKSVSVQEFSQLLQADSTLSLVDVRTAEEFSAGHIDGAVNIDVLQDDFEEKALALLPADRTVAVYCRSGKRSLKAAALLAKKGYRVVNLRGGWIAWTGADGTAS